jgi:hypothetical protein
VAHSKHDPLDRLLKCSINELTASILPMSAKECETYTREMLDRIGGPSFDQLLMRIVETMLPTDNSNPPRNPDEYYFAVRDLFPHVPTESDVVARVLAFAMRMSVLRLEKHPLRSTVH